MTIRLKNPRTVVRTSDRFFQDEKRRLGTKLERELERNCPVDTGELRASIKRGKGDVLAYFTAIQGVVQNARGPHSGWIQQSERKALRR